MLKRLLATIVAAAFLFFMAGYYKPTVAPVKDNSLQTGGGMDNRQVQPPKEQAEMLALVNQARAEAGLPALAWNQTAADVAAEKARDMVALEYFDHTSPTYDGDGHRTSSGSYHTSYYATFEVESGDRLELQVSDYEYGQLAEGDRGKLTFQRKRFLQFERERGV